MMPIYHHLSFLSLSLIYEVLPHITFHHGLQGETWSLPYSLGPPHMEKDKNESNVACFDCCFHPNAIAQMEQKKQFRNSLVLTAIEGIEEAYKRQKQEVSCCDITFE